MKKPAKNILLKTRIPNKKTIKAMVDSNKRNTHKAKNIDELLKIIK